MNINNDHKKRRGKITSFPTGKIIEPNRKFLEGNYFYPKRIFCIIGNTWNNIGK